MARRDFDAEQRTAEERRVAATAETSASFREAELALYREKSKREILERKWVQVSFAVEFRPGANTPVACMGRIGMGRKMWAEKCGLFAGWNWVRSGKRWRRASRRRCSASAWSAREHSDNRKTRTR